MHDTCITSIQNPDFRDALGSISDWALTLPHDPTVKQEDGPDYCLGCDVGVKVQALAFAITDAEKKCPATTKED